MTSLWDVVGPEIDAEQSALRMTRAKVACASLWPFLARAESTGEFEHRLEIAGEHIAARVDEDLLEPVTASLREDFAAMVKTAVEDDANKGAGNPAYFTGGEEHGPATGDTNQFPPHPTGSDPMDPINGQYPANPEPWTVPPGGEWKEAPMQFGAARKTAEIGDDDTCRACGQSVKYVKADGIPTWSHTGPDGWAHDDQHVPHPQRYPYEASRGRHPFGKQATEGVAPSPGPNPNYFAGGPEGIAGEQNGFPADAAVEDPEDWANVYGTVPPAASSGSTGVTAAVETIENDPPDSDENAGTEFDSDAEAQRYRKKTTGHRFYDPAVPGLAFTAAGDPFGSDNPFAADNATSAGGVPPTPPSLEGGPGSSATVADGGVPQTTSPRQMPGGGAPAAPSVPQENTPGNQTTGSLSFAAFMRTADEGPSQRLFSDDDPSGLGDLYREHQINNAQGNRPRLHPDQMGINTPQNVRDRDPIRTVTSDPSGVNEDDEEER